MKKYDIIVVGAGAAGLLAAGRAAEKGAKVVILEKNEREGRKLLITGKGRCNISNNAPISEFIKKTYPNGRFLKHAFSQFFSKDIVKLLNNNGVETAFERGGRIFPVSNNAADVVRALLKWVKANNVDIKRGRTVKELIVEEGEVKGVKVSSEKGNENIYANKIILCGGGSSYPATGSNGDSCRIAKKAGHKIETLHPALVPIETEGDLAQRLQGLSLKNVKAVVWANGKKQEEDFGEMLFTHYGLTGPIILTLSRLVVQELLKKNDVEISIDLKPALDEQKLDNRLLRDINEHGKRNIENIVKLWVPSKLVSVILQETKIDAYKQGHQLSAKERRSIRILLKDMRFKISGYRSFKEAIITAGGVATKEINSKTMESKLIKNLYLAGEMIDIDAETGGYNLQIAFSTGWLAGQSAAS